MTLSFLSPAPWSYLGDFVLLCPTFVSSSSIFLKFSPFRTNDQHLICYRGCWGFISHPLSLIPSSPLGSCWIVAVVSGTDSPINSVSLHWSPFFLLHQEKLLFLFLKTFSLFSLLSLCHVVLLLLALLTRMVPAPQHRLLSPSLLVSSTISHPQPFPVLQGPELAQKLEKSSN